MAKKTLAVVYYSVPASPKSLRTFFLLGIESLAVRVSVYVCVSAQGQCLGPRDLSGGITLTGEKVKPADLKRRVDNLFGQKMLKALKRSFPATT